MGKFNRLIIYTAIIFCFIGISIPDKTKPGLFGKQPEASKMIIKHNIGYHFKRIVREVSRELFVSRRINLHSMVNGISTLKIAKDTMQEYCKSLPKALSLPKRAPAPAITTTPAPRIVEVVTRKVAPEPFEFISRAGFVSFTMAEARCKALGMQLPEIYNSKDDKLLNEFMNRLNITKCHAGIKMDLVDGLHRFISTGFPLWKSYLRPTISGQSAKMIDVVDDGHARFFYTNKGALDMAYTGYNAFAHKKMGNDKIFADHKRFDEYQAAVVCTPAWDGRSMYDVRTGVNEVPGLTINAHIVKRSASPEPLLDLEERYHSFASLDIDHYQVSPNLGYDINHVEEVPVVSTMSSIINDVPYITNDLYDIASYQQDQMPRTSDYEVSKRLHDTTLQLCDSTAALIDETYQGHRKRLEQVLSHVDISVHYRNELNDEPMDDPDSQIRSKRNPIAKFFFKNGISMIWSLFGFVQDIYTQKRISKIEKATAVNREDIKQNAADIAYTAQAVEEMAQTVSEHAFSIDKLKVVAEDLDLKLIAMNSQVELLHKEVRSTIEHTQVMATVNLVTSLATRIDKSLESGHLVLEDITHSSLMGQTSPRVLPSDQVKLVQDDISRVSSAMLDPDFSRMQSIVVSDPKDNSQLLVIVNAAAVSRQNLELVELTAIPTFGHGKAYAPIIDHQVVALDQYAATFVVLSKQEHTSCLAGRCYISNMVQPVISKSCGIPQFFDRHLEACEFEVVPSDGIFLEPAMPDGFFFSFRDEVTTQMFCKSGKSISSSKKLKGMGVLQLPTGCELSVTDRKGHNIKVKGQPKFHLVDASAYNLADNVLIDAQFEPKHPDNSSRLPPELAIEENLMHVQQAVDTAYERMKAQDTFLIILTSCIVAALVILLGITCILYRNSRRFRKKVKFIRESVVEIGNRVSNHMEQVPLVPPRLENVSPLTKIRKLASPRSPRWQKQKPEEVDMSGYINLNDPNADIIKRRDERIYVSSPAIRIDHSVPGSPRLYPRMELTKSLEKLSRKLKAFEDEEREINKQVQLKSLTLARTVSSPAQKISSIVQTEPEMDQEHLDLMRPDASVSNRNSVVSHYPVSDTGMDEPEEENQ